MRGLPDKDRVAAPAGGSVELRAQTPAKVNLSLLVGPPAADGYHPLLTVFTPIDLYDELEFDLTARPGATGGQRGDDARAEVVVECPGVPRERNLITRALEALSSETGWVFAGAVRVGKAIPTGAGLGGGSSNAACVLKVASTLMSASGGPVLKPSVLRGLARGLGADVPFFLDPRPSLGRGVGERLAPLALPALPLVLVLPDEELSTAEAYRTYDGVAGKEALAAFDARCRLAEQAWRTLEQAWQEGEITLANFCVQVASLMQNDLERASLHLMPGLAASLSAITRHGALAALMSGSGPSLFGLCASHEEAARVASGLMSDGMRARVTWAGLSTPTPRT